MTAPVLEFDFYVGGIEDSIIALLRERCEYARDVTTYGGELDEKNLREALQALESRFPLYLVSYFDGDDVDMGGLGPEIGAPRQIMHKCSFAVVACDDNARGEKERRRGATGSVGVFQMISDARSALERMQFAITFEGETYMLNPEPLNPTGVVRIAHLPELTAYAQYFDTHFILFTPDRRAEGAQVQEIQIDIYPDGAGGAPQLPGVTVD